jgi:ribosome-binding factor A
MKSYPRSRATAETVREAVARIIIEDIKDPRVSLVTVTGAEVSADLRHANVFVTAHGDEERYREALAGLESAKGRIRHELGRQVRMKYVPELHFRIDPSVDVAMRISQLIIGGRAKGAEGDRAGGSSGTDGESEAAG